MLTALLLSAALSQALPPQEDECSRGRCRVEGRGMTAAPFAFFEFAPTSGAGMTAACACTTPTGAKGEAMTFTRTGAATCAKQGLATTGIANGDLVVCANNNEPRVEPSGGVLGLRVESARTNSILRSQELDNAAWAVTAFGASNPVVTANAATAPDGTATADKVEFPSVTGANYSVIYNTVGRTSTAASWSHSVYVKGVSGSGTIYLMSTPGGTYNSTACAFVSTSWTRCSVTGTETVATWYAQIGFDLRDGAQTGQGAQSVYLWGVQGEAGAYATSYIPTVAASATRNAEAASLAMSGSVGPGFCLAASSQWPSSSVGAVAIAQLGTAAPDLASVGRNNNTAAAFTINATSTTPAVSAIGTAVIRAALSDTSGTRAAWWNAGSVSAPAASMTATASAVSLGVGDGIVTRVQVDPSSSRCSP